MAHSHEPSTATGNLLVQSIAVYPAAVFTVSSGANLGDGVAPMDDLVLDDVYELSPSADTHRLALETHADGSLRVAADTETGTPGQELHLDCALTLMSPDGRTVDALVIVETDRLDHVSAVHFLPLAPLLPRVGYALIGHDRKAARRKLAQSASVSFTRGTRITLGSGRMVPVETLQAGDRVLTRDDAVQNVRWVGQNTVRATGDFAPIVIRAGALNNDNDLVVSPDHRLFVYQRQDELGTGTPELMIKARHLVNGDTVYVREGGFVDYFQILFDRHQIIYAEGIAAESMLIDPRSKPALPQELIDRIRPLLGRQERRDKHGLDVARALLDRPDVIDLLRRASMH